MPDRQECGWLWMHDLPAYLLRDTDRSGRIWEYRVYTSPSGPAFWLTIPDALMPDHVANYTVHFDGVMAVSQEQP